MVVCFSCFTTHIMPRSKGFKKNIEFDFIHFADSKTEAMWFTSRCEAVHQQGRNPWCSLHESSAQVLGSQELKLWHGWQGRKRPFSEALKMPTLNDGFAFSSPKLLLCIRLKHTCQHTDGPPARASGTGEGSHRVCAMAEPSTSTARAEKAARQQPSRWTLTQDNQYNTELAYWLSEQVISTTQT